MILIKKHKFYNKKTNEDFEKLGNVVNSMREPQCRRLSLLFAVRKEDSGMLCHFI